MRENEIANHTRHVRCARVEEVAVTPCPVNTPGTLGLLGLIGLYTPHRDVVDPSNDIVRRCDENKKQKKKKKRWQSLMEKSHVYTYLCQGI